MGERLRFSAEPFTDTTVEEIKQQTAEVLEQVSRWGMMPEVTVEGACLMFLLTKIYERMGQQWVWEKAHRGP